MDCVDDRLKQRKALRRQGERQRRLQRRRSLPKPNDAPPSAQPYRQDRSGRDRPPITALPSASAQAQYRRVSSQRSCLAATQDWRNRQFPGRSRPAKLEPSPLLKFLRFWLGCLALARDNDPFPTGLCQGRLRVELGSRRTHFFESCGMSVHGQCGTALTTIHGAPQMHVPAIDRDELLIKMPAGGCDLLSVLA